MSDRHHGMNVEAVTTSGAVRGVREDGLAVFRGIPFARPPVGALRFAAPEPPEPWDGVRTCTAFGPPPPQSAAFGLPTEQASGDDWLTCNVWTPDPSASLPVMVWIHGGAYLFGHSAEPAYDGALLSREGGVVVVTLNYRVGMEGFGQIEDAPANRGLLDQIAALTWVQDNIAAFGGDPDAVTVFGESAGAGSIAALLVMPRASGLFHRAIAQSVPGTYFSRALADDIGAAISAEAGARPVRQDLAAVAPDRLAKAMDAVANTMAGRTRWGLVPHTSVPFSPVVDGDVLPGTPWEELATGVARDIPLIVGHNRDEFRFFTAMSGLLGRITDEQASMAVRLFAPDPSAYRNAFPDASPETLFERVRGDWLFRMPSAHLAEAHAAAGGRAHLYELTWQAPELGACHVLDVPLVWGNLTGGIADLLLAGVHDAAAELSATIRPAWTAFASSGEPGWPAYEPSRRLTRVLDLPPDVAPYPEETSRALWSKHTFEALPLLP
ncbi:para-nitrobenzyl esterase [Actinomadura pelletieri DSM 43383]|uniref:Carboxylic ester hydrolase n=1 Tax=Actinomadura pelletieri DSM 43383 TaxID=1120940 RepID=A0A495QN61_9ACTN|nr:carboxylesterase family protein [Actinomadura pelletieri]RKS74282.1 para-nitrobenzyl esterase [Actinomadura pelletieri DSM 43383]